MMMLLNLFILPCTLAHWVVLHFTSPLWQHESVDLLFFHVALLSD
uniref:Uncharacterized protein n=1 Tax=Rhizophora mucronata TaxID=61149 RepID=A0A2P2PFG4_RHIMU